MSYQPTQSELKWLNSLIKLTATYTEAKKDLLEKELLGTHVYYLTMYGIYSMVGETCRDESKLSRAFKEHFKQVDWRGFAIRRNELIHEYDRFSPKVASVMVRELEEFKKGITAIAQLVFKT